MAFRAMDAGCGGVDGDDSDLACPAPVTAVGLYLASTGTVWHSYACDSHAHQLIAPRPLRTRDRDRLSRREQLAQDAQIGRRYAGERDGPLARGAAATALVRQAMDWARRHPFRTGPPTPQGGPPTGGRRDREIGRLTVDELADELGVEPGDIRVLLSWLDPDTGGLHPDGTLLNDYSGEVRDQFDPMCVRTVPDYWWPGSNPDAGKGATKMR
ncbi:hypothetical protein Psed_6083 [Pseudonocardia dioxanivorans CB1190]|uniref:Uncharacterized protein n=1 Tax=Pseudonocardia dioxanivorans (strain ATCC 55486 / DSM 44775 / JCM 13855 / CB1190) TaxID=675635 RepID=F4CLQ6_PSEUX|nr:hypothetical protein [Pseudonocardia dioxanivorans]AEA28188.1 hypothetical protein Psed_6083 [Pseudonocardia dioxanivorans CB1190]